MRDCHWRRLFVQCMYIELSVYLSLSYCMAVFDNAPRNAGSMNHLLMHSCLFVADGYRIRIWRILNQGFGLRLRHWDITQRFRRRENTISFILRICCAAAAGFFHLFFKTVISWKNQWKFIKFKLLLIN